MIIPTKHTHLSESLLGFGAYLLNEIDFIKTVDGLWNNYQNDLLNNKYSTRHSFDNLLFTLVFLYSIGIIEERDGGVVRCD